MAQYKVSFTHYQKGRFPEAKTKKLIAALSRAGFQDYITVEPVKAEKSRADRLSGAASLFEDAKSVVEELKDEMENWHGNMPENLQSGDKGSAVEEAQNALEQIISDMDNVDFESVEFPGMY